jgi:hypothetical protein
VTQKEPLVGDQGGSGKQTEPPSTTTESPNLQESAPDRIERRGNWFVLSKDATLKRIVCKCASCGHVCTIGAEALEAGGVFCSGCARPHSAKPDAPEFAAGLANLESRNAWKRHKGGGGGSL